MRTQMPLQQFKGQKYLYYHSFPGKKVDSSIMFMLEKHNYIDVTTATINCKVTDRLLHLASIWRKGKSVRGTGDGHCHHNNSWP